jgi:hypothetical protein
MFRMADLVAWRVHEVVLGSNRCAGVPASGIGRRWWVIPLSMRSDSEPAGSDVPCGEFGDLGGQLRCGVCVDVEVQVHGGQVGSEQLRALRPGVEQAGVLIDGLDRPDA